MEVSTNWCLRTPTSLAGFFLLPLLPLPPFDGVGAPLLRLAFDVAPARCPGAGAADAFVGGDNRHLSSDLEDFVGGERPRLVTPVSIDRVAACTRESMLHVVDEVCG